MNYILYAIDWRSRAVAVLGGFATRYQGELAQGAVLEKLGPDEAAYMSFEVVVCTDAMRQAFEQFNRINGKAASDANAV